MITAALLTYWIICTLVIWKIISTADKGLFNLFDYVIMIPVFSSIMVPAMAFHKLEEWWRFRRR